MAIAKRGTSRSKRDKRRSHHFLTKLTLMDCPNCHEVKLPHTACPSCGFYKGRQVKPAREA
ncbi:50S ribosomal protein L32 [Calditrichota bacterium]